MTKTYRPVPHYLGLIKAICDAVTVQSMPKYDLNGFLNTTQKVLASNDSKLANRYLQLAQNYFSTGLIFNTTYNKLYLIRAKDSVIDFKYNDQSLSLNDAAPAQTKAEDIIDDDGWGNNLTPNTKSSDDWDAASAPSPTMVNAGAVLSFSKANLVVVTASDSAVLFATDGILAVKEGIIAGQNGRFTWEKAGLLDAYVMLGTYNINLLRPMINSQDAVLHYDSKIKEPVKGVFTYRGSKRPKGVPNSYPRFFSKSNDVVVKNLGADLDYQGGFSLVANRTYTTAADGRQGVLLIKNKGKVVMRARSRMFEFTDSLVVAPQAEISLYIDKDSLTHPAIKFNFNRKEQFLRCNKMDKGGFRQTPYSDGFHHIDITCDAMYHDFKKEKTDFYILSGKTVVPAVFESFDFFDSERYTALSGQLGFHPLQVLYGFLQRNKKSYTYIADLATAFNKPFAVMKDAMQSMLEQGHVYYDNYDEVVSFTRKGLHNVNSFNKRKDFDVLVIPSYYSNSIQDNKGNATIDFKDKYLTIRGVKNFRISDSLQAVVKAKDGEVRINKNRDFAVNGELTMSNYRFKGKNFYFRYDDFAIDLNKIDSITFIPQKLLKTNNPKEIGGDIRYTSGKIYLSKPDNKSGRASLAEYPRLVIPEGVTVYFDQTERGNKAYPRSVYFKIPSIDHDSLNSKDIAFVGTFHSNGLVPVFQDRLVTMPDNTLGFKHKALTPTYKLYNSNSAIKFATELMMDKSGLHTEGDLLHLTATLPTKDILFMPDSVTATGVTGEIKEALATGKTYFPLVNIKNYGLKWVPRADSMTISTKGGSFDFFANTTRLEGQLLLRSMGLFGMGKIKRNDSETLSSRFKFNKDSFVAEAADIRVGSNLVAYKPALLGKDVDINFNVNTGIVVIEMPFAGLKIKPTVQDSSSLYFPYTSYKTNISRAEWNINAKTIGMKGNVASSTFTSTEPKQEGLNFNASEALYEIEKQVLNIKGVPYIKTADAKIMPEKGLVLIRRDAEMAPFLKAKVVLDTISGYHRLANANIQILSKNRFEGDGTYRYVNLLGDTTNIKMGTFELMEQKLAIEASEKPKKKSSVNNAPITTDPSIRYYTEAKATILEVDRFFISPRMRYRGEITMVAYEQSLRLNGDIQLDLKKRKDIPNWLAYKGSSSQTVNIDVVPGMKSDNALIYTGLHYRKGSGGLYTTFLSPKEDDRDENILVATGPLVEDAKKAQFTVTSPDKAAGKSLEGNKYTHDDKTGIVSLEGKFDLYQPAEYVQMGGTASISLDSSIYRFNTMMVLGFPLPPQVMTTMGEKIVKANIDERNDKAAEEDFEKLSIKMASLVGDKATQMYKDRTGRGEKVPMYLAATKFNAMMVLSNVNLKWSEANQSYFSVGKIGVASIGQIDINAQMEGFLEIQKNVDGDEIGVYLEASPEVWYYFAFKNNELGLNSSESDFNAVIGSKASKGKSKDYTFLPVDLDEKMLFVDRFTSLYRPKPKLDKKATTKKEDPKKAKEKEKKKEEEKEGF
jgi:predicted transcriptional regulator